ncbi:MAG: portal protein [Verrucomicrobia bacterium TMED175]|nr:MAG: portal protein [Verrucomicrobia bacterium TMED175]
MAELFGFKITRANQSGGSDGFTAPSTDDGTLDIVSGGGHYASILDMDGRDRNELDLIRRYRDIAQQPECDTAIEDIANEAIVSDERDKSVSLSLDQLDVSPNIKQKIRDEFDEVLRLMDFSSKGHDIFRRWYVDGRIYYHKIIDRKSPRKGIQELRYIDPRKIKKVREQRKEKDEKTGLDLVKKVEDFYLYNEKGLDQNTGTTSGIRITADSVSYCPSGLVDMHKGTVLSYLNKAIKPVNQLRMIEDALVIYRISRAPERRIFYIDVGNLPKIKAEAYLKDVMNRYRNKLVYDARTGEIRDDRNHMSMLEDFWLPRREGGRGTEITTLPGGSNLGEIDDITYFQKKLYRSLNVPISRLESESQFSIGRSDNITRDELKFTKFVQKLRKKFSVLFLDILKTQLILKGVIAAEEWDAFKEHIQFDYMQDGHFTELKNAELLQNRIDMLGQIESYVGTYFSKEYVRKNVLRMTDNEIEEIEKQIKDEGGGEMGSDDGDFYSQNDPTQGDK